MSVQTFVQTFERAMRANGTDGQYVTPFPPSVCFCHILGRYRYVDKDERDLPYMLQVQQSQP